METPSNVVAVPAFFFIVKVVQVAISVLVLGLSAASFALRGCWGTFGAPVWAILVCILTWISCGWYIASSRFMPNLYHRIPAMVLEVFLWLWWLSSWTSLAAAAAAVAAVDVATAPYFDDIYFCDPGAALVGVLGGAAALGAINWVLVFTTAVVFLIHLMRFGRNQTAAAVSTTQPAPKYEMQPQPQYQQTVPQQQAYPAQQPYGQPQYGQQTAQFDQSGEHKIAV